MGLELALTVIALFGLGVIMWVLRRWKAYKYRRSTAAKKYEAPVPAIRVVTLGLQGSGKTLLMTSMFRSLQTPGRRGYYIRAPFDQIIELNKSFQQAADPERGWPASTTRGEMREFEFTVMTLTNGFEEQVLKIGYLEYPGELLTEAEAPGATSQTQLLQAISHADALIGIIDGMRIREAYEGNARGRLILQTTLDAMVYSMLTTPSPIAFVISKWDLLDTIHPNENMRLHVVRNMLMEVPAFRDLIRVQSARRVIRLIPVTAVGHDFTFIDHGKIRKKPQGHFEPDNVDVPLAAVVPDILNQIEMALDERTRERLLAEAQARIQMGPVEALHTLSTFAADKAGRVLLSTLGAGVFTDSAMALFLGSRAIPAQDPGGRRAALSRADLQAQQILLTRRRVISELQGRVAVVEAKLPSSRLWIGG